MKPTSFLRSFLALAGSSLLAISYSHGQTILADSYLTSLDVSADTTLIPSLNFPSILNGPLTGSSTLTLSGYTGSQLSLVNNTGNTFSGNITVDSGTLRIAGSPFASNGGFVAGSMSASDTITVNRAGTFTIDDNVAGGYTANRFGTSGARPAVNLAGGTINLSGLNNATSSVQTFGALTSSSGQGTVNVTRNSNGNPTLAFSSLTVSSGSLLNFNDNGTGTLGTGTNDPRITFTTNPSVNGIIVGAAYNIANTGVASLATYGANGVQRLTTYDLNSVNINGAASTANVYLPNTGAPTTLTADTTVNSITHAANANWSLGGFKLTIVSGMFMRTLNNVDPNITNGTLTAGNGTDDIDLNLVVAQNNMTIGAVIADNGSSNVTLVKSADAHDLSLNGTANNTYTGGTYVLGGKLTTSTTASRTYLGTGKVTVDGGASYLTLGAIGATSNATGDDFTAKNGGTITLSAGNHGTVDTFNIDANSVISGASATNSGLASLTRGTNITLAAGAIIGHAIRGSALSLTSGTIQNLGTNADLYYGFYLNQNNAAGQITIGNGTAFRGISTDRSAKEWQLGTINIASGTTSVDFQGVADYGAAAALTLGNGATGGQPVITSAVTGTVDINARGLLTINDSTATFGDTSLGQNIRFVSTAGSTLTVTAATGMGSGTGIASALVNNGGSLAIGNTAALNGAVTVEAGGRFTANQTSLTGSGALTFNAGSILQITNATGFSGSQAATGASLAAGTIVRLGVTNFGTAATTLDSIVGGSSPIYQIFGGDRTAVNPTAADTTILTLNKNGSGVGGILTNDSASRTIAALGNGKITLGANGGVIAVTTNTTLNVQDNIDGAGSLTIGTTDIIDGAPKLGTVNMDMTVANTYTGGTIVNAGTVILARANMLGATTNQLTVNTGGTVTMSAAAQTVGNLTGTGGIINAAGRVLTIGQGDNGGGNYQGSIQGASAALTKTGTGTITLSGNNTYSGATSINDGALQAVDGIGLPTSSILQLRGGVLQSSGTFTRNVTTSSGGVNWSTSSGGFAARGRTLNLQLNGGIASVTWNDSSMVQTGQALIFGSSTADSLVDFKNALNLGSSLTGQRTITVNDNAGSTTDIARISGQITNTAAGWGILKNGAGTLELTHSNNTYSGATSVTAGKLVVGVAGVGAIASNVTVSSNATLGGSGTITGNIVLNAEFALNAKDGGKLAPGNSPGVLTATGTTTLNTGSIFAWTIDTDVGGGVRGTEYSGLNTTSVSGSDAVFQIVTGDSEGFADNFWTTNHNWTDIFKSADGSTPLGNDWSTVFSSFAYSNGTSTLATPTNGSFSWTSGGSTLTWSAVPEPTSALAGLLLTAGLLRRRRK